MTPSRDTGTCNQEEKVKKAVLGVLAVLAAVLAGALPAGSGPTETVACCGQNPK